METKSSDYLRPLVYRQVLSHPACSTANAIASSENLAMCCLLISLCPNLEIERETHVNREYARIVVDVHGVVHAVYVRVHITREPARHGVSLRSKGSGVVQLGIRHVVGTGAPAFLSVPSTRHH